MRVLRSRIAGNALARRGRAGIRRRVAPELALPTGDAVRCGRAQLSLADRARQLAQLARDAAAQQTTAHLAAGAIRRALALPYRRRGRARRRCGYAGVHGARRLGSIERDFGFTAERIRRRTGTRAASDRGCRARKCSQVVRIHPATRWADRKPQGYEPHRCSSHGRNLPPSQEMGRNVWLTYHAHAFAGCVALRVRRERVRAVSVLSERSAHSCDSGADPRRYPRAEHRRPRGGGDAPRGTSDEGNRRCPGADPRHDERYR